MLKMLFRNIGAKVKGLAKVLTGIGVVLAAIVAIVFFVGVSIMVLTTGENPAYILVALLAGALFFVLYTFLCWLAYMMLYAFGDLVDNTQKIREHLDRMAMPPQANVPPQNYGRPPVAPPPVQRPIQPMQPVYTQPMQQPVQAPAQPAPAQPVAPQPTPAPEAPKAE